jgi:SAM-dependent methyltransferase
MLERLKSTLRSFRIYRAAAFVWHFIWSQSFRRGFLLFWRHPENLFQYNPLTASNRYPRIFTFVAKRLAHGSKLRLLSFGCSTGEEVFSLRTYFPGAFIKGIDINAANIAVCRGRHRRRGNDPAIEFEQNFSAAGEVANSYDGVFCMAVFQRPPLRSDPAIATCEPHLRFSDFERTVAGLAACVKPGGYLVIRHSMFRFTDSECARDFRLLLSVPFSDVFSPCFGRDNQRLPDAVSEEVVFQKITGSTPSRAQD